MPREKLTAPRKNLHLFVPEELYRKVKALSHALGQTVTDAIVRGLELYLKDTRRPRHGK